MTLPYSGETSSYHHKRNDTPNPPDTPAGLRKVWFLDAQWSTCPVEVEEQVKDLWRLHELGNDRYMLKISVETLQQYEQKGEEQTIERWNGSAWTDVPLKVDYVIQYIREHGIPDNEEVIIHWWW